MAIRCSAGAGAGAGVLDGILKSFQKKIAQF